MVKIASFFKNSLQAMEIFAIFKIKLSEILLFDKKSNSFSLKNDLIPIINVGT